MDEVNCTVCGHNMRGEDGCARMAVSLSFKDGSSESKRVSETFGCESVNICWCCWLKAFGVVPEQQVAEKC